MTQNPMQQTWLVAEREIRTRLSSKAFVSSIVIMLVLILASVVISGLVSKNSGDDVTRVAIPETAVSSLAQLDQPFIEITETAGTDEAKALVESGDVEAAVYLDPSVASGMHVIADEEPPGLIMQLLSIQPEVTLLNGDGGGFDFIAYFLAIGFGLVFFITAMTFGNTIVQSVIEEKQTRIIEILLATVKPRVLLAGKVIGNSLLALATVAIAVALVSVGMLATGQDLLLGALGSSLIWFGVLFIFGFLLTATMYAAAASLVSRLEDAASVTTPVMMLIMIPYMLIIFFFDNPTVLTIMSYVPFSAPVGMPMRLYYGDAMWWEPIASLGIILATTAIAVWLSAKIYEGSILRTGQRVKLGEALKKA
ncbi:ABC transporter permease [Leucobacter chinensis]|uniref:ABC transporter permease n=1 Tax=Leucobacter chinensis TaxID=2851010 RepID=UPI00350F71E0